MRHIAFVLLISLPALVVGQVVNIAGKPIGSPRLVSVRVPINGVVVVSLSSGQRALVQFTSLHGNGAEYRWKYRRDSRSEQQVGTGSVLEKYEKLPALEGAGSEVLPLPGHDVIVRAGEIRAEWSTGGDQYCYFYYNPGLAQAAVEPAGRFDGEP